MTRTVSLALALAASVVMPACAPQTQYVSTNPSPRPLHARSVEQVTVFTTSAPEHPYVEVGMLSSRVTTSPPQSKATLFEAVRMEAAKQGCDGIIYSPGSAILAEATCIVFK